jgi:hypothetical protein
MLKRWRVGFDPVSKYFQYRHIWVLLPGLSIQFWNEGAFAAIGNELGHFLFVEDSVLKGADRRMGKILVELDIHNGLLEALDIEWRGNIYGQKLDYLGLLFRCTFCRRTGHLHKDCQGIVSDEESESSMLRKATYSDSPVEDPSWSGEGTSSEEEVMNTVVIDSDLGKLKHLCPSFFSTLSASEIVRLNLSMASPKVDISANTTPKSPIRELEREGDNIVLVGSTVLGVSDQSNNTPQDCIGDLGVLPVVDGLGSETLGGWSWILERAPWGH